MDDKWRIIMTLLRLSNTVEDELRRMLSSFGFGLTDFRLLLLVSLLKGSSQKQLARKMGLSQVVVSTRLDRLERLGLLSREQVRGRLVSVALLPAGDELLCVLVRQVESSAPIRALFMLPRTDEETIRRSFDLLISAMGSLGPISVTGPPAKGESGEYQLLVIQQQLNDRREALDHEFQAQDYRMTESVLRLTEELDSLLKAYVALRQGEREQKS